MGGSEKGIGRRDRVPLLRPDGKTAHSKPPPVEPSPRIAFPIRRHVRMRDHAFRRNAPPIQNTSQQAFQPRHERFGERGGPVIVQLDPDGARIDVSQPAPCARPCVPRAFFLCDQRPKRPIPPDQVMRRNLGLGVTQPFAGRLRVCHRSIVEHHQFGPQSIAARPEIGRRNLPVAAQFCTARRKGCGFQPQAYPSPSGSRPRRSRCGPPRERKSICA